MAQACRGVKRGFSLIELITVLAIIGIGIGIFYNTLFVNWTSFEKQVGLIDLQMEADKITELIFNDGKNAQEIQVAAGGKQVTLCYSDPCTTSIQYRLTGVGIERSLDSGATFAEISRYANSTDSNFRPLNSCLEVDLLLRDTVFGDRIELRVSTQVFPRNVR